ncbi:hypothetical protein [Saccharothrix yanglingensis]|uniref:hypothetical protein n=1 Tax=Saccharothrix yanglingensis TaxID=659496 RepID=UPI0027D2657D|nr:hypothetical protein [Saccharothrix yanglingensis]
MLVEPASDCVRIVDRREGLVARGKKRIACTRRTEDHAVPPGTPAADSRGSW